MYRWKLCAGARRERAHRTACVCRILKFVLRISFSLSLSHSLLVGHFIDRVLPKAGGGGGEEEGDEEKEERDKEGGRETKMRGTERGTMREREKEIDEEKYKVIRGKGDEPLLFKVRQSQTG